jgi:hypothetical protein
MMSLANQRAIFEEKHPHYGDAPAVLEMRQALAQFKANAVEALRLVQSDEGSDALAKLVDDAIPAIEVWISNCEDEGEI